MPDGILIIDKPADWTSHDVVAKLRGLLHEKRIGHGGTLDPMATGVLPVFIGRATRAVEFAENGKKEYIAGLRLGIETDTQDTTGRILRQCPLDISDDALAQALRAFVGPIDQIPPMYSAIKINGQKLYQLARAGKEVVRPKRAVTIYEAEVLRRDSETDFTLRFLCSKGTYVRTLCHDLGQALGCGGAMCSLRRTMAAGFTLSQAVTLEEVAKQGASLLLPTEQLFLQHPVYTINRPKIEFACRNGSAFSAPQTPDGIYRVYGADGDFLCLSRCENGTMKSMKNFFGA